MIIRDLYIEPKVESLILSMALRVELTTGIKFKTNKSDDLINLLRFAKVYDDDVIRGYFERLGEATDSIAFVELMRSLGIDVFKPSLKAANTSSAISSNHFQGLIGTQQESQSQHGKRKVVYRGQVTYV